MTTQFPDPSLKGKLVTVFGGGGFIGTYLAQKLLAAGARLRVAERDPRKAFAIKPLGGLGQTQFVAADITHEDSVGRAVHGSDAVVNLVGIFGGDLEGVHVRGAANVAAAAKAEGAACVHISAIGADPEAQSKYGSSKGRGEDAVRSAHKGATIMRPSIVFGPEDNFINRFADLIRMLPVVPVIGSETKFQPVYVGDVASAITAAIAHADKHQGKTFELGGPEILSMRELQEKIATEIGRKRDYLELPGFVSRLMARATGWLPGAPITYDQWLMLQHDNVVAAKAKGLRDLGIAPTPIAAITPDWLVKYRRHGRFAKKAAG